MAILTYKLVSAYHFKYFQNIQFKNHGIAPTPPTSQLWKLTLPPFVGGRFEIFSLKWRERMNLKVPGAILPLGCAILSTRAKTVRGTPLRRTRVNLNPFLWPYMKVSTNFHFIVDFYVLVALQFHEITPLQISEVLQLLIIDNCAVAALCCFVWLYWFVLSRELKMENSDTQAWQ